MPTTKELIEQNTANYNQRLKRRKVNMRLMAEAIAHLNKRLSDVENRLQAPKPQN